jgi:hypothetical protein
MSERIKLHRRIYYVVYVHMICFGDDDDHDHYSNYHHLVKNLC